MLMTSVLILQLLLVSLAKYRDTMLRQATFAYSDIIRDYFKSHYILVLNFGIAIAAHYKLSIK
jgi:hypothetical protein